MNKKTLLIVLAAAFVVKMAFALAAPLTPDESLHWMQSRHMAWGFGDHPPVTALLNLIGRSVFGMSLAAVRIFAVLSTTLCSLIAYGILKETGRSTRSACLGALFLQIMPVFGLGILMTPVIPFAALVFAAEYFFIKALRSESATDHLLWGVFLGLSMMTYYIAATAVLAVAVFCIVARRDVFSRVGFWIGVFAFAAIFAPNLWWNMTQGREGAVYFQLSQRSPYAFNLGHALSYTVLFLVIAGPLVLPALVRAARRLRSMSRDPDTLFAIAFAVPCAAFFLLSFVREAGAHWAIVSFLNVPLLLIPREEPGRLNGWAKAGVVYVLVIAAAAISLLAAGPLTISREARLLFGARSAAGSAYRSHELLERTGQNAVFATDKWGYAGVLSFYTPGNPYYFVYPLPDRHGQDYKLWNREHTRAAESVFVSTRPHLREEVQKACASYSEISRPKDPVQTLQPYGFYLCTDLDLEHQKNTGEK